MLPSIGAIQHSVIAAVMEGKGSDQLPRGRLHEIPAMDALTFLIWGSNSKGGTQLNVNSVEILT